MVLTGLLALFLLGDAALKSGCGPMLLLAPWVLLGLWVVYEISFVSHVRVDGEGVLVQNLLRRTSFGWSQVRDIDLRWQLVFSLQDGADLTSFGGPAHARPRRSRMRDEDAQTAPAGLRDLTDIRDRWQAAGVTASTSISRQWDWKALGALGIILAWAVASVLIVSAG
ncbi:PH domain-containing protein [Microbacterium oxydans]|nr:PH domain-containing protein [Microbacterium oxydans]